MGDVCVHICRCTVTLSVRVVTASHQQTAMTNEHPRSTLTTSVESYSVLLCRRRPSSLSSTSTPARPRSITAFLVAYLDSMIRRRPLQSCHCHRVVLLRCTTRMTTHAYRSDAARMAVPPSAAAESALRRPRQSTFYTRFFATPDCFFFIAFSSQDSVLLQIC